MPKALTPEQAIQVLPPELLPQVTDLDHWKPPAAAQAWTEQAGRDAHRTQLQALYQERDQALRQAGQDPQQAGYLLILVSSSLPESLLRAYARDAVWTGGVLVFRGIDPDHNMMWFIKNVIVPLQRENANAHPGMTIDPRPFSAYTINAVPALVYLPAAPMGICEQHIERTIPQAGNPVPLKVHDCAPVAPSTFWKVEGAVSVHYALERFAIDGAPHVAPLLRGIGSELGQSTSRSLEQSEIGLSEDQYRAAKGPADLPSLLSIMGAHVPATEGVLHTSSGVANGR